MSNPFEDLEIEDTEKQNVDLVALDKLVSEMLKEQGELSRLETLTREATQRFNKLAETDIPEMMERGGLTELKRSDGSKIKVDKVLFASLVGARKDEILKAVRERGGGDLVKNELTVTLNKGSDNAAKELEEKAKEMGLDVERSETIHAGTYKKWIGTQMKSDKPIDLAFFGAHQKTIAKIVQ